MSDIPPPTIPPAVPPPPGGSYTPPPPPPGGSYTPPPTGGAPAGSDRTLMVVLAYLWLLALIPLLTKKDDSEVQWHAKNGVVLFAAEMALAIALVITGWIIPNWIVVNCGLGVLHCLLSLGVLVLHILAIIKAINGDRLRVTGISDVADKL